jgi:hypothetical protein
MKHLHVLLTKVRNHELGDGRPGDACVHGSRIKSGMTNWGEGE